MDPAQSADALVTYFLEHPLIAINQAEAPRLNRLYGRESDPSADLELHLGP